MRMLIHLTTGVENPTKAALGLLVAATARGISADDLVATGFTPSPPNHLVELLVTADRSLTY